jgi:hypothetical protein
MMKMIAVAVAALFAVGCGGNSPMAPSMTSPTSTTPPTSQSNVNGTWSGTASDSSSGLGTGAMMGQAGMGTMTLQMTQNGATVTGTMSHSGMNGVMPGSFTGTLVGDQLTFTMTLPMNSMMSACSANATGTASLNWATMTMTGVYQGTHSCSGPFANGQMTMVRR